MSNPVSTYAERLPEQVRSVWKEAVKVQEALAGTASDTRARLSDIELQPAAGDAVDAAYGLAARVLQAQRDAVISVAERVPVPTSSNGRSVPEYVHAAYEVAGRVLEAQRHALHTLVEVTIPAQPRSNGAHAAN